MQLSKRQINRLQSIVDMAQKLIADARMRAALIPARRNAMGPATRRHGADLLAFKKTIKAERKKGASVAALAGKYGVTPSYIYQLR